MFSKNFPLAFAHDVPWGVCKPEIEGAIPLSRHVFLGLHNGFCFWNPHFFLEKLENLTTLISTLQSDNSQWELSSWPPSNGSCVCYSCFHFYFPISAPFIHLYHLPVSFRHSSLHLLLCRLSFPPISTYPNPIHHSWFISNVTPFSLQQSGVCMFSLFWIFTAFLTLLL